MKLVLPAFVLLAAAGASNAQVNGPIDLTWSTIDCGGGTSRNGSISISGTIGQHDTAASQSGSVTLAGGFWPSAPPPCYADCDTGTGPGVLDIFDFLCFQNRYFSNHPYACNCDRGTGPGLCDIFDFLCFQNAYDAGCP